MGWKSTKTISRRKALKIILEKLEFSSNDELGNALEALGFGDNTELPYFGHNFTVVDNDSDSETF